ncbi:MULTISPECIES: DUF6015 family protein [Ferroplasma]|jgi:hypothetical protein|uniref:Uncharacterized protein n=3 Tax=Ferroplasma TaxID=74968 RepID=S0AQ26_FERAC|nr:MULTISPECIES: DUF6015 family protein [Ferroplasma]AGO60842.1 hypothetical protein FACI_IFERC00001G0862 [Ferroplasma acidarmanus Fer1]ARD85591.1 hypothetical protein FAD_1752 [Ferroplasma acidiphilum]MCL4349000.1 hypothetical protein [Candidatus Thermoplasmatota archaeon]WMT52727.1 MAG: DUF6015 family protein [Ferroplasma acidiphilum]
MATSSMEIAKLRSRAYVKIDELSKAISNGLSLQNRKMGIEESQSSAEHIINFFGYSTRVIDNMLEPEDRDVFYTMEDLGILETEREETTLFDGREWRIHYWLLNVLRVLELAEMNISNKVEHDSRFDIYSEIPDEYWKPGE